MRKLIFVSLFCLGFAFLAPLVVREEFFRLPAYSASFDCDDGTLLMMERLQGIGITATPILGNLKMKEEQYLESDHIWLLADIAGRQIAFDRGTLCADRQHYEGFLLSKQQLLEFVAQDYELAGMAEGNPAGP